LKSVHREPRKAAMITCRTEPAFKASICRHFLDGHEEQHMSAQPSASFHVV
jgi:hypothetical protein